MLPAADDEMISVSQGRAQHLQPFSLPGEGTQAPMLLHPIWYRSPDLYWTGECE